MSDKRIASAPAMQPLMRSFHVQPCCGPGSEGFAPGENAFRVLLDCNLAICRLATCCLWRGQLGHWCTVSPSWPSAEIFLLTPVPRSNSLAVPRRLFSAKWLWDNAVFEHADCNPSPRLTAGCERVTAKSVIIPLALHRGTSVRGKVGFAACTCLLARV